MNQMRKKKVLVQAPARANTVARHARKLNRSAVFQNRKKAAKNGRTRFKIDFKDVGDSQKIGRTSCKRDDSKKVFHKTVLLSSDLSAHLISA